MFNLIAMVDKETRQNVIERFWTTFYQFKQYSYDVVMYKLGLVEEKPFALMTKEDIADSFELNIPFDER